MKYTQPTIIEVHIAIPKIPEPIMKQVFADLAVAGMAKNKYFIAVTNTTGEGMVLGTPPTGHDLKTPGAMSTKKTTSIQEALVLIRAGMNVLRKHNLQGNFEMEGILENEEQDYSIDMNKDLVEFKPVPDSPAYENHVVWRGTATSLPSREEIIEWFRNNFSIIPHQFVDFSRDSQTSEDSLISRVATIYQPSKKAVLELKNCLSVAPNILNYAYHIGEQVSIVGEDK